MTWRAALGCALLLLPIAAASPGWEGELRAATVQADSAHASAALIALVRFDAADGATTADSAFTLDAAALEIETQQADPVFVVPDGFGAVPANPSPQFQSHGASRLTGLANRLSYRLELMALEGQEPPVLAARGCLELESPDRSIAQSQPKVNPTRVIDRDVSQAVLARACSPAEFIVRGSFLLTLWAWDAELQTEDGVIELRSGYDRSDTDPTGTAFPTVAKSRQQYITVTDGELVMPLDESPHYAFVQSLDAQAEGAVRFTDARGQVRRGATEVALDARSLTLEGDLDLGMAQMDRSQALTVQLGGQVVAGEADGQPLALMTTTTQARSSLPWAWIGLGLAATVVTVPLAMGPGRRGVQRYLVERREDRAADLQVRCEDLVALRRFEQARRLSAALLDLDPLDPDLQYLRATVLGNLGRLGDDAACREALEYHAQAAKTARERLVDHVFVAENALQAAITAAAWHPRAPDSEKDRLHDLLLNWMAEAVEHEPGIEADLSLHIELQPFLPPFVALMALKDAHAPDWLLP